MAIFKGFAFINKKAITKHQKISYNNPPKELLIHSSTGPE
jgi:hypothetical protein